MNLFQHNLINLDPFSTFLNYFNKILFKELVTAIVTMYSIKCMDRRLIIVNVSIMYLMMSQTELNLIETNQYQRTTNTARPKYRCTQLDNLLWRCDCRSNILNVSDNINPLT